MSGVLNGDGTQPREQFPGIRNPTTTGAAGSAGAGGRAADDVNAGQITTSSGAWYPDARPTADTHGTVMPGQADVNPINPGPAIDYTDTGAGHGGTDAWPRFDWQQDAQ